MSPAPARRVSRRYVAAAGLAFAAGGARAQCPPPRVLFVCPAGTVKSAIARETLRRRARERGVAVVVQSRGVRPEDHISPGLAANLRADGLDPAAEPARAFRASDARAADIVIAFDEAAQDPALRKARVWITPSWNSDYAGARAALAPQVEALLDELAKRSCRPSGAERRS